MSNSNRPFLSIVIPTYNSKNHYWPLLKSLLKISYQSYEIIIVDDGSTDGSYEEIKKIAQKYKNLRVIKTLKRRGIPGSRNLGIEVSKGDFVAFFDIDMEVSKSWPGKMINVLSKEKNVGGVLPKVLDFNNRDIIQAVGFKIDPHSVWVVPKGYGELDEGQFTDIEEIAIGAAGSIFKRNVVEEIEGFDENLGMFDDIDFGWRVKIAGWKTVCVPNSVIYHWTFKPWSVRPKTSSLFKQNFYLNCLMRSLIKNMEKKNLIRYLPWYLAIMLIRVFYNLLNGNSIVFRSFFSAMLWNITNLGDTISERRKISKYRKVSDWELNKTIFAKGNFFQIYQSGIKPLSIISKNFQKNN